MWTIITENGDSRERIVLYVFESCTNLHDEMRRLHFRRRTQMLQYKLIRLFQPQIDTTQRLIIEWSYAQHAHVVIINVQYPWIAYKKKITILQVC